VIKNLIKIAQELDQQGFSDEADIVDSIIEKVSKSEAAEEPEEPNDIKRFEVDQAELNSLLRGGENEET
jgi:hypothetical protein